MNIGNWDAPTTFKKLIMYSLVFFVLLISIGEITSRTLLSKLIPSINNPLYSSGYDRPIEQYERFKRFIEQQGKPDCIFLGSSLTQVGIDPVVFANAFNKQVDTPIMCFNAGMDGSHLASTTSMALMLSNMVQPRYIILGISAGQFYGGSEQTASPSAEENFSKSSWIQYTLGNFNVEGWLIDHSLFYRMLVRVSREMFRTPNLEQKDTSPANTLSVRPEVTRTISSNGYGPVLGYRDSSPLFKNIEDKWATGHINDHDFTALQQLMNQAADGDFRLILVEMPISHLSPLARDTVRRVEQAAHQTGVPYLATEGILPLPATAFADSIHLHISGSRIFSNWLGTQLGQAVATGMLTDVNAPIWSPTQLAWDTSNVTATLGLTEVSYKRYMEYIATNPIIPRDAIVFSPSQLRLDIPLAQSVLGFEADHQLDLSEENRQKLYQLMYILGRTRYTGELKLSPELAQWKATLEPSILITHGIHYVLCRVDLTDTDMVFCPASIANNAAYSLVGKWDYFPLFEQYALYQVNGRN